MRAKWRHMASANGGADAGTGEAAGKSQPPDGRRTSRRSVRRAHKASDKEEAGTADASTDVAPASGVARAGDGGAVAERQPPDGRRASKRWRSRAYKASQNIASNKEVAIRRDVKNDKVDFNDLLILKYWQTLTGEPTDAPKKEAGDSLYDEVLQAWKKQNPGRVVAFPVGGVYLLADGKFHYTVLGSTIRFDWSEADQLIYRIDSIAEQAREWWPHSEVIFESGSSGRRRRRIQARLTGRKERNRAQCQPHLERAFAHMTGVLSAVDLENEVNHPSSGPGILQRLYSLVSAAFVSLDPRIGPAPTLTHSRTPSADFAKKMAVMRSQTDRAESLLAVAAQRSAQVRYARGMFYGTLVMTLGSILVAPVLALTDVPAQYAIAAPAGAIGALVSVLQRMTSSNLKLDFHAGKRMLTFFGAVRPIIGAVFGMALFVLFQGGLIPALGRPHVPLAFFAAIGFLGGFNERFAQDMLVGSAKRLTAAAEASG